MIASVLSESAIVAGQLTAIAVCAALLGRLLLGAIRFFVKLANAASIITHEFVPKGGGSMRDAIDRIETRQVIDGDRLSNLESFAEEVKAERE